MKWIADDRGWKGWRIEGTPFGVEMVDRACYVPFRLWNETRLYVRANESGLAQNRNENLTFTSKAEAFAYVEEAVKKYQKQIIISA
jgi:hypothetical protein